MKHLRVVRGMPKNRHLQNIVGTEHITDAAEQAIAAQAEGGATLAFKNVAVAGQSNIVADAATDTLNIAAGANVTITTNASTDTITIAATDTNTDTNTFRPVTAGGNTLGATETLAFTAGSNVTISESAGAVTIAATGGSPGGSDTQIQYNNGGSFGGISSFTYDDTTDSEKFVISASSDQELVRITQTGTGKAFIVEDAANPDGNRFEINNTGQTAVQGTAGTNNAALYVGGTISAGSRVRAADGLVGTPGYAFNLDTNTGMQRPADDTLAFITGGSERLRVGSSGQIGLGGANYGTAGQVLTSNGSSSAPTWQAGGGGGSGYMQAVTNWPNFGTNVLVFIPASNPPIGYSTTTSSANTISDDIQFAPWIFRQDTTIKDIGFRVSSSANPAEMCVYESNSDGFPTNKVANSTATFSSPTTGVNMATMAAGASGITFSANELYWCAITNTTTGANISVTTHGDGGSVVGYPGFIFNKQTLQLISGTVNSLPSSIGTLSISAGSKAFLAFARKA